MARDPIPLRYLHDRPGRCVWVDVAELCTLLDVRMVGEDDGRMAGLLDLKLELEELLEMLDDEPGRMTG